MFSKILNWVKTHKLLTFNILVVLFILFSRSVLSLLDTASRTSSSYLGDSYDAVAPSKGVGAIGGISPSSDLVPSPESISDQVVPEDRKVITNSNLSLLVKNVDGTVESIRQKTLSLGGFMINTNVQRDAEADKATIEVRVPSDDLVDFSKYLGTLSVKVVYENIMGTDITDQYTDYEEKLSSLKSVKERFQEIMDEAVTVDEILSVQNKIFGIQNQIDSIKGQLTYMDRSTSTSKVTITISTLDLCVPYPRVISWRPDVIFKKAVRSLISVFRAIGSVAIWVLVFSPLVILFFALKITVKYLFKKRKLNKGSVRNIK